MRIPQAARVPSQGFSKLACTSMVVRPLHAPPVCCGQGAANGIWGMAKWENGVSTMRLKYAVSVILSALLTLPASAADRTREQVVALLARSVGADLAGLDLSDIDLSGLDFRHADLTGASLFSARLVSSNLQGANLTRV